MIKTYEGFFKKKSIKEIPKPKFKLEDGDYTSIQHCFDDLIDKNIGVYVYGKQYSKEPGWDNTIVRRLEVNIKKESDHFYETFSGEDVIETLLFALPYLQDEYNLIVNEITVGFLNSYLFDDKPENYSIISYKTFEKARTIIMDPHNEIKSILINFNL